jgi:hypothetical protein
MGMVMVGYGPNGDQERGLSYADAADLWTGPVVFGFMGVLALISAASRFGWRVVRRRAPKTTVAT